MRERGRRKKKNRGREKGGGRSEERKEEGEGCTSNVCIGYLSSLQALWLQSKLLEESRQLRPR